MAGPRKKRRRKAPTARRLATRNRKGASGSRAIGANIRDARLKAGLSQEKLGKLTTFSQEAVSGWETGYRAPTIKTLRILSGALGQSVDELLRERDDIEEETPPLTWEPVE